MGENQEFRLFSDNTRKSLYIYEPCTVIQSQDARYFEIFYSYYYTQSSLISRIFRKSNYQITEMEQQILKAVNQIKYVSKKGVTVSGIQIFLKKTSINSNNDNYRETDKSFIDEYINSDDPNKTASDSEINMNSMEHHLSNSIASVKNLNLKSCDCITRLESLKDEFNLKAINIKKNFVLKTENLKDEITSIRKDIEPTFDKNLIETINPHEGENEKLKDKIKLLETENKILKDDIGTRQKLIDFLLQHKNLLLNYR